MVGPETLETIVRSLWISGTATALATLWSIPLAYAMALRERAIVVEAVVETMVGMPTVLLGLLLYFLLSSSGPLAPLRLLYTPTAIVLGETILVTPLMISTCYRGVREAVRELRELGLSLGASDTQLLRLYIGETLPTMVASIVMGFSRAVGELGIALMVGGNIAGYTRTMTTAIALNVSRGEFEEAAVLGLFLLLVMVATSLAIKVVGRRG